MKKDIYIGIVSLFVGLALILYGLSPISVVAQLTTTSPDVSETPSQSITPGASDLVATDSATDTDLLDIRKRRDRFASVVAELRKKDEQIIAGQVKSIDTTSIEIDTIAGSVEKLQLDDLLTKYYRISGAAKEEIQQKDIKSGQYAIVTGFQSEGSLSANEIYLDEPFDSKAGRIVEIDSDNYTFKLESFDKETLTVSIDRNVTQEILDVKGTSLEMAGFARLKEGDTVHIVYPVKSIKQQTTFITPIRMLVIPLAYFNT